MDGLTVQARLAFVDWLIATLTEARGPGFTLLPVAHMYDRTPRSSLYAPNRISGYRLASRNKFANRVAARNWERAWHTRTPWDDETGPDRARLSFFDEGFKPYRYHEPNASLYRTALGLKILEEIAEVGEMCGAMHKHSAYKKQDVGGLECYCLITSHDRYTHAGKHVSDTCTW
jgi:hypothetical protein